LAALVGSAIAVNAIQGSHWLWYWRAHRRIGQIEFKEEVLSSSREKWEKYDGQVWAQSEDFIWFSEDETWLGHGSFRHEGAYSHGHIDMLDPVAAVFHVLITRWLKKNVSFELVTEEDFCKMPDIEMNVRR
jgi:hypothetical protein